ncbi:MAG TPA: fucose-binding lectin II [Thermoanaerobaculia bacterium]|nr:fucose-binding lectin II [Thermoanaerobaculia bacterium]
MTQPNTTIYVTIETFASYTQQVTLTLPDNSSKAYTGTGEFQQIGAVAYDVTDPGDYQFTVQIQYQTSATAPWQLSSDVIPQTVVIGTLNYTVAFSEDSTDDDNNDSLVTFRWFSSDAVEERP